MAKWFHLRIQWLLEEDWDTIRVNSLSSPQANDVQSAPSYEGLDLQANALSLRFSFTKSSSGDVGGKRVMCETDGRLCCWNLGLLKNLLLKGTGPVNDKPPLRPLCKLWLVKVSFLTFLEMSELPSHLYWLANKLQVSFHISRKTKIHKIDPFLPSRFHPSTLIQTEGDSQKILLAVIVFFPTVGDPGK